MTQEQLLQAADRLIGYADEIAPTDIPNFSAWRADYKDYLREIDRQDNAEAAYFEAMDTKYHNGVEKPVTGRQEALRGNFAGGNNEHNG